MNKRILAYIGTSFAILVVVAGLLITSQIVQSTPERTPTPDGLVPGGSSELPQVIDLAPNVPQRDKATLKVLHPDGTYKEVFLPLDMMATFIRQLPSDNTVLIIAPPLSFIEGPPPTPSRVTDLALDIPRYDKGTVIVRHPDGSYEEFLLPTGTTVTFIRDLPLGDTVAGFTSAPSSIRRSPPSPPTISSGTELPPGRPVITPVGPVSTPPPPPPPPRPW